MEIKKQKVLIIGSGGREHALGWKIAQSPRFGELYFAPGNAGTKNIGINVPIKSTEIAKLIEFVKEEKIDLTIAMVDSALALGVVDEFKNEGLRIFGATKDVNQLEASKSFAKDFMVKHTLPSAKSVTFTEYDKAEDYVRNNTLPIVIKVDGLASGKGIFVCEKLEDALFELQSILVKKKFGEAGNKVVIEEFLEGNEVSVHAFTDGKTYSMFPTSENYKSIGENNIGQKTGGMGSVCPLSFISDDLTKKIEDTIVTPTLSGIKAEGNTYSGIIFPEVMLTKAMPKILAYNTRLGDLETQTYMRLLNTDLLDIIDACIDGNLDQIKVSWFKEIFACTVVIASKGYPESYEKDNIIDGINAAEQNENVVVFHAGTTMKDGNLVTNSGRVLGVSAIGESLEEALKIAYEAVEKISFSDMQYRRDIGKRALDLASSNIPS